jgi:hypothetical protein
MADCVEASLIPKARDLPEAPSLEIAGSATEVVIPDLVSEERAESVGNPCLALSAVKTDAEQTARA